MVLCNSSTNIAPIFHNLFDVQFHVLRKRENFFNAFSTISIALSTPAQNPLGEANNIFNLLVTNTL